MKKIRCVLMLLLAIGAFSPLAAWAKADVKIELKAEKEVIVTEKGQQIKKIVAAKEILPGETVTYTVHYSNTGNEPAANVLLDDPIPAGTTYIPGSASEVGDVTFSIDGGKSYKKPALLTYEVTLPGGKKEKKIATPEEYTNIRWMLPVLPPGGKGSVNFKVILKQ